MKRRLLELGLEPAWISGADLYRRIAANIVKSREFVAATDIQLN
jgi:hypothetical protein